MTPSGTIMPARPVGVRSPAMAVTKTSLYPLVRLDHLSEHKKRSGLAGMTSTACSFQRSSDVSVSYFEDVRSSDEAVEVKIHQRLAHHIRGDVVAFEVLCEASRSSGVKLRCFPSSSLLAAGYVLVGGDQKPHFMRGREH